MLNQPDEFTRMGTLNIVVAGHGEHWPAPGPGTLVKEIKIILLRRLAALHGQNEGGRDFSGGDLVGQADRLAEGAF